MSSTWRRKPGWTTVVESNSSTTAGPVEGRTGRERVAVVDRAVDVAARLGEVDLPVLLRLDLAAAVELPRRRLRDPPHARQPQAHDLDRLGRRGEAVRAVVLLVEPLQEAVAGRNRQLVALADVAEVDLALELDRVVADSLALELVAPGVPRARQTSPRPRAASSSSRRRMIVIAASRLRSVVRSPVAEKMPGLRGISSVGISASRASALACTGPAPPKPTSTKSRGS